MSRGAKKWLAAAVCLAALGAILFTAVMAAYHWDLSRLSTDRFETNTYEISEAFRSIELNTDTADIYFAVSDDDLCRVVCREEENRKHSAHVQDGTLTIGVADNGKWYEQIGFGFRSPEVTVYLPETEYASLVIREDTGDIVLPKDFTFGSVHLSLSTGRVDSRASSAGRMCIAADTGDIHLQNLSAGELALTVSTGGVDVQSVSCMGDIGICVDTGDADLSDVFCGSLHSDGSTGSITLKNVLTEGMLSVQRSTGDVRLEGCDAGELEIRTDTGRVSGSLLSPKVFIAHSDTGRVDVPETVSGGKCRLTTSTGDIQIEIARGE